MVVFITEETTVCNIRYGLNTRDRDDVNRFIGNVTLSYEIVDFLNLSYRIGIDRTNLLNNYMMNKNGGTVITYLVHTKHQIEIMLIMINLLI